MSSNGAFRRLPRVQDAAGNVVPISRNDARTRTLARPGVPWLQTFRSKDLVQHAEFDAIRIEGASAPLGLITQAFGCRDSNEEGELIEALFE